jgi:hypothetical protein
VVIESVGEAAKKEKKRKKEKAGPVIDPAMNW